MSAFTIVNKLGKVSPAASDGGEYCLVTARQPTGQVLEIRVSIEEDGKIRIATDGRLHIQPVASNVIYVRADDGRR